MLLIFFCDITLEVTHSSSFFLILFRAKLMTLFFFLSFILLWIFNFLLFFICFCFRSRLLSKGHILQTFLHMFQVAISYLLMLVFMTYNSWLCLSVVLGAGLGYFFFGYKRLTTIDSNEHCH